jgi:hypothetical protein
MFIGRTYFVIFHADHAGTVGIVPERYSKKVDAFFLEILAELCKQTVNEPARILVPGKSSYVEVGFPFDIPFPTDGNNQQSFRNGVIREALPQSFLDSADVCPILFLCNQTKIVQNGSVCTLR